MLTKGLIAACALTALVGATGPSLAFTGIGCPDLPEYYRAVGTVENGEGSCGMSMAEAKRILARGDSEHPPQEQAAPPTHRHKRHHYKAPRY